MQSETKSAIGRISLTCYTCTPLETADSDADFAVSAADVGASDADFAASDADFNILLIPILLLLRDFGASNANAAASDADFDDYDAESAVSFSILLLVMPAGQQKNGCWPCTALRALNK